MTAPSDQPETPAGVTCRLAQRRSHRPPRIPRQFVRAALCLLLLASVAACANSVAPPNVVQGMPQDRGASLRLVDVSTEAARGVAMTPEDLDRIAQQVRAEISASSPDMLLPAGAPPPPPQTMRMKIVLTRYDEGNAFARFMLAGLGQIYIEGDVLLIDSQTMQTVAKYQVAKDFSFGGMYGGITTIRDVEKGFARSVAAAVQPKT